MSIEKATFGAGCFWGVEAAFAAIPGVTATAVGYEGGTLSKPAYKDVCTDQTGHAEVVETRLRPGKSELRATARRLLRAPRPHHAQPAGPGLGHAVSLGHLLPLAGAGGAGARQQSTRLTAEGRFKPKRIVTEVVPAGTFWRAEDYHQRYLEKRGLASCHI